MRKIMTFQEWVRFVEEDAQAKKDLLAKGTQGVVDAIEKAGPQADPTEVAEDPKQTMPAIMARVQADPNLVRKGVTPKDIATVATTANAAPEVGKMKKKMTKK